MYVLRIVSGNKIAEFSGLVPETFRITSRDILRRCGEYHISISANAKSGMIRSIALGSYFKEDARRLEECVGISVPQQVPRTSGKCTYAFRRP